MNIETLPFLVVHGAIVWKIALGLVIFVCLWRPFRRDPLVPRLKPLKTALFHSVVGTMVFLVSSFCVGGLAKSMWRDSSNKDTSRPVSLSVQVGAALPFHRSKALDELRFSSISSGHHRTENSVRMLAELSQIESGCEAAAKIFFYRKYPQLVLEALRNCGPSQRTATMRSNAYTALGQFQMASQLLLDAVAQTTAKQGTEFTPWSKAVMTHLFAGNMEEAARLLELEAQARIEKEIKKGFDSTDVPSHDDDLEGEARDLRCLATAASLYGTEPTPDKLKPLREDRIRCRLLLASFLAPEKRLKVLEPFKDFEGKLKTRVEYQIRKLLIAEAGSPLSKDAELSPFRYKIAYILWLPTIERYLQYAAPEIGLMRRVYNSSAIQNRVERPILGSHIALYNAQIGYHKRAILLAQTSLRELEALLPVLAELPLPNFFDDTLTSDNVDDILVLNKKRKDEEALHSYLSREMMALHTLLAVELGKRGDLASAQDHLNRAKRINEKYPDYEISRLDEAGISRILGQRTHIELANDAVINDSDEPQVYSAETPPVPDNFRYQLSLDDDPFGAISANAKSLNIAELLDSETSLAKLRERRDRGDKALSDPGRTLLYILVDSMD